MQWFAEAHGNWRSVTGKPANYCMEAFGKRGEKCGIPHEFGSTGFGVARATAVAAELLGMDLNHARVAIEGFGNVGSFAFKHLRELGATIVAVADKDGTAYNEQGLDEEVLTKLKAAGQSVGQYPRAERLTHDDIFTLPVDVLIPAAVTDVIHDNNKNTITAKLIVEGANIPMTEDVERELYDRGIFIVPDFIANAGGVISSYAEYRGYNPQRMFELVERKITDTVRTVVSASLKTHKFPRAVAMELAQEKVREKTKMRKQTF
jgi:glutamate dehydrogenase/leucine dehydrogenase